MARSMSSHSKAICIHWSRLTVVVRRLMACGWYPMPSDTVKRCGSFTWICEPTAIGP
jgi:hypothetical protein